MTTKNINAWDWDVRVRERNLIRGVFTDKDVEKMMGGLPDLGGGTDTVVLPQPAMSGGAAATDEGDDEAES
jgi:hypothetical protein